MNGFAALLEAEKKERQKESKELEEKLAQLAKGKEAEKEAFTKQIQELHLDMLQKQSWQNKAEKTKTIEKGKINSVLSSCILRGFMRLYRKPGQPCSRCF